MFSSVSLPISQGLQASYVFGSNYVDIVFTQLPFAINPLLSGNHVIIADHIDTAVLAGNVPLSLLDTMNRQPSIILFRNLLDQLSPAVYYGWYPSAVMNSHALTQTLQDRFDQDKKRAAGSWDTYTLESRRESSIDATAIADYTNFDTVSVSAGVDYAITPDLTVGGLIDYSNTHFDLDTWRSFSTSNSVTGALYAQHKRGAWRMQALGFAGYDDYQSTRVVALTLLANEARSTTKGGHGGAEVSSSYTFSFPWFEVTPNASLDAFYWTANGFHETGAGEVALAVKSQTEMLLSGRMGLRFAQSFPVGNGVIRPFINISSQHQFNNGQRTIKAVLFGSQLSVKTNGLAATGTRYDVGLDWDMTRRVSLQVRYSTESGGVVDESMGVRGGLNVAF
jgi:outer membrane autotransporter protein